MNHDDIWRALDTLAAENGLSASGLAKKAGLDSTTFNRSKRRLLDGRARWPSTESLSKVLAATGASLETFTALVGGARALPHGSPARGTRERGPAERGLVERGSGERGLGERGLGDRGAAPGRRIPLIGFAQAGKHGHFDDAGFPVGGSWDEVGLPDVADPNAYALEISGESMAPVFRDGDIVVVSPAAPTRRGDRVVARARSGEVMAKELVRRSAVRIELRSINPAHADHSFELGELAWLHRILWVSQ